VIDVRTETLVPLSELPNHIPPRNGRKVSIATCYRWSITGVRGVRLETAQVGGQRVTSLEALQRFTETLTALRDGQPAVDRAPAPVKRRREEDVSKQLDSIGI
jgi:hypothetical protein